MKCILIDKYGEDIDKLLTIAEDHPKPIRKKGEVLIKVQACALAPGDIRVMKGHCDYFQAPQSFPYIPGGDISGTVEEADENSRFKKGDAVLAMFESPRPLHGLAEYACAKESLVEMRPETITPAEAACLTSSALTAFHAVQHVKTGNRVLILGGSGGVGTFLIQLASNAGASYIATTSTDEQLCHSLGADHVINYKKQNFWDIPAFKKDPFDVIFDLGVGRYYSWKQAKDSKILKNGWNSGKYVTASGDEPEMKIHNLWQTWRFVGGIYSRVAWTSLWRWDPSYIHLSSVLDVTPGVFQGLTQLVQNKQLKVVFHPSLQSSFKLDLESVKRGFHIMNKRAGHGKVVIHISK